MKIFKHKEKDVEWCRSNKKYVLFIISILFLILIIMTSFIFDKPFISIMSIVVLTYFLLDLATLLTE